MLYVSFDPPRAVLSALLHNAKEHQLQCDAALAGSSLQILFDTGASDPFLNAGFGRQMELIVHPLTRGNCPTTITYANAQTSPVVGVIRFLVADLAENLDAILGIEWLKLHNACWDSAKGQLTLSKNGRSCNVIQPCLSTQPYCSVMSYT